MKRSHLLASALTLSAASILSTGAYADCAEELAQLKEQSGSMAMGHGASGQTGGSSMDASGSASASGSSSTASGSGSTGSDNVETTAAGETPGNMDQQAVTSDNPTFTEAGQNEGQDNRAESTGALSGIAPTPALTDEATNESSMTEESGASGETSGMASSDSSSSSSDMAASTGSSESASGSSSMTEGSSMAGDQQMASTHLAAAQMALDAGNEEACMAAVEQARESMM